VAVIGGVFRKETESVVACDAFEKLVWRDVDPFTAFGYSVDDERHITDKTIVEINQDWQNFPGRSRKQVTPQAST
jgi:hypothetical protein